jgi:hypothetical protein
VLPLFKEIMDKVLFQVIKQLEIKQFQMLYHIKLEPIRAIHVYLKIEEEIL